MSIFELEAKDHEDYQIWMQDIREQINRNVSNKSEFYCFNFQNSESHANGKFAWEQPREPSKRYSTLGASMRSSISTTPTLGDELTGDIPQISVQDLRISQELMISPIVLLPHKR